MYLYVINTVYMFLFRIDFCWNLYFDIIYILESLKIGEQLKKHKKDTYIQTGSHLCWSKQANHVRVSVFL